MSDIESTQSKHPKVKIPKIESRTKEDAKSKGTKNHKTGIFIGVILLLALAGIGMGGYFVYQSTQDVSRLDAKETQIAQTLQASLAAQQEEVQNHKKLQAQLEAQAAQLHQLSDKYDWQISEALYLVNIAQERLNTIGDIPTAIKQLKMAEDRLQHASDARTIAIRESIAKDIVALENKARFDKIGLWVEVGALRSKIENLSFHNLQASIEGQPDIIPNADSAQDNKASQPAWRAALDKTWEELKGLIRVREFHSEKLVSSLAPQEQTQLLRAMDLMLVEAQWGILQEETRVYQQSLEMIEERLNTYFIQNDLWKTVSAQITNLKTKSVKQQPIDLSASIEMMKKIDRSPVESASGVQHP